MKTYCQSRVCMQPESTEETALKYSVETSIYIVDTCHIMSLMIVSEFVHNDGTTLYSIEDMAPVWRNKKHKDVTLPALVKYSDYMHGRVNPPTTDFDISFESVSTVTGTKS